MANLISNNDHFPFTCVYRIPIIQIQPCLLARKSKHENIIVAISVDVMHMTEKIVGIPADIKIFSLVDDMTFKESRTFPP